MERSTTMNVPLPTVAHRLPAIDGLRALAVVAVIVYHLDVHVAGVRLARGGFLGVDLFFVLSGFLIGRLVFGEVTRTDRLNLPGFWARRFRRLIPAALTLILAVIAWDVVVGWGRDIRRDVIASVFWIQNWQLIEASESYVDQFRAASPLRHFWSLSIEEQWYLLFPLLMIIAARALRRRPRVLLGWICLGVAASATAMWVHREPDIWRSYYGTDSRISALLIGCGLALAPHVWPDLRARRSTWIAIMMTGITIWAVLCATAGETATWMYPWGFLLAATSAALAVCGTAAAEVHWFDGAPMQWLGSRSYGLYLWHWPIIVALTSERTGLEGLPLSAARLAATGVLVELSFRLIERPIRVGRFSHARPARVIPLALAASTAVVATGVAVTTTSSGGSADVLAEAVAQQSAPPPTEQGALEVFVVGDSVAFGLGFGQDVTESAATPIALINGALPGCGLSRLDRPDSQYLVGETLEECLTLDRRWTETLDRSDPDAIVYVVGPYDNLDVEVDGQTFLEGSDEWNELIRARLTDSFDQLTDTGAPLIAVLPACRSVEPEIASLPTLTGEAVRGLTRLVEEAAATSAGQISVVDPSSWLCDADGNPTRFADGTAIRDDGIHYTAAGKTAFWEWLAPTIERLASQAEPSVSPSTTAPEPSTTSSTTPEATVSVLVVGDSIGGSLARGAVDVALADGVSLAGYYYPACGLIGGDVVRPDGSLVQPAATCDPFRSSIADAVSTEDPDVVVLLTGVLEAYDRRVAGFDLVAGSPEYELFVAQQLDDLIATIDASIPVLVLTPPCLRPSIAGATPPDPGVYADSRTAWLAGVFERFAAGQSDRITGLDLHRTLCAPDGSFRSEIEGTSLFDDGIRFSDSGASLVWEEISPALQDLLGDGE